MRSVLVGWVCFYFFKEMSASQLAVYSSSACKKAYEVDIVLKDGAPWFRACDIARILGYKNSSDALKKHVKEKYRSAKDSLVASLGGASETLHPPSETLHPPQDTAVYISEPGLYSLVLKSKMKEAEAFQDWVVEEVLPEIRAKGSYQSRKPQTKLQICLINEFDLHAKIVDFIRRFHPDANVVAGLGENQTTEQLRIRSWQLGYTKGQCDLLLLNKHKKWTGMAIELKSPVGWGTVSPEQKKFLERLRRAGFKTLVSCDYDELVVAIQEYFRDVRTYCEHCDRWVPKKHAHPEA
jgi:prophage antirepressor-like protein